MRVDETRSGDVLVLALEGRLDGTTAPDLAHLLRERIDAGERLFVFDVAALSYVTSMGLRVILGGVKELQGMAGRLVVAGARGTVQEVLEISGISRFVGMFGSREEALESFR